LDDVELRVEEFGTGPALIALHGGPGLDHRIFGRTLDALGKRFRVVLCDLRGHGQSALGSADRWTIEQFSRDVEGLASKLGLSSYNVLAHSFGVFVALQLAVRAPVALERLVLVGGAPSARFYWGAHDPRITPEPLSDSEVAAAFSESLPACVFDASSESYADLEACAHEIVFRSAVYNHFAKTRFEDISLTEDLGKIVCPVLLLSGVDDPVVSSAASRLMRGRIANARHVEFENCGHFPHFEQRQQFLDMTRGFLIDRYIESPFGA